MEGILSPHLGVLLVPITTSSSLNHSFHNLAETNSSYKTENTGVNPDCLFFPTLAASDKVLTSFLSEPSSVLTFTQDPKYVGVHGLLFLFKIPLISHLCDD